MSRNVPSIIALNGYKPEEIHAILEHEEARRKHLKENYKITKCYLVQRIDNEGNEIEFDYVFGTRKDAEAYALKWLPVKEGASE